MAEPTLVKGLNLVLTMGICSYLVSFDRQNFHKFLSIGFAEWASRDTDYLKELLRQYRDWELGRSAQT